MSNKQTGIYYKGEKTPTPKKPKEVTSPKPNARGVTAKKK